MPRFYYEYAELETGDDTPDWTYIVYDRQHGEQEVARCDRSDDAEKIVDALNAYRRPSLGVFG
jgi:hypothetical protein